MSGTGSGSQQPPKTPEHIRITTSPTDPDLPSNQSPSRSRSSRTYGHAHNPSLAETLRSPQSPTSGIPARRLSTTSASGARRRGPTNTVKNSKYVTLIPGSEPGLNPGDAKIDLHTHCGITVVDFSQDEIIQTELDNDSLLEFLEEEERPEWSKVRWINLNGLSWDCISAVAKKYKLHRLGEFLEEQSTM